PQCRGTAHPRHPRGPVRRPRQGRPRPARPPAPPRAPLNTAPAGRAVASPAARPDPSASPSALRRRTLEGRTRAGDATARTAGRGLRAAQGARQDERAPGTDQGARRDERAPGTAQGVRQDERAPGTASCDGVLDLTAAYARWV